MDADLRLTVIIGATAGSWQNRIFQVLGEFSSSRIRAMRSLPPLAQLRAFEAAARHLSFKDAADELAVTPTAISHQIKLLESYCGRPLFRRRPRPLALTEAGARFSRKFAKGSIPLPMRYRPSTNCPWNAP